MPKQIKTFTEFFDAHLYADLANFDSYEFLVSTNRYPNTEPPKDLWGNIIPTAMLLQRLREHFRKPLVVTSCYRNIPYNAGVGGGKLSTHLAFMACDFAIAGVDPLSISSVLLSWRGRPFTLPTIASEYPRTSVTVPFVGHTPFKPLVMQGLSFIFAGGIGTYRNFVHLDTRGVNVVWTGK